MVDDRARLIAHLHAAGATDAEIAQAEAAGALGVLIVELSLRPPGDPLMFADVLERTGVDETRAVWLWHALGLPDPREPGVTVTTREADVLAAIASFVDVLGEDAIGKMARVMGSAAARIAEAVVGAMRVDFELPQLGGGTSYPDVVSQYAELAAVGYPQLAYALDFALRRHMISFARGAWTPSADGRAMSLDRLVGFVDLVGYTELTPTLDGGALSDLVSRFEAVVATAVAAAGGRVVKTIGDEVMFVVPDAAAGCSAAVTMLRDMQASGLPAARAGIAAGPVVGYEGDYFGDVVNLASRLVALAEPMTVLADASLAASAASAGLPFVEGGDVTVKGFPTSVAVLRLAPA